MVVVGEEKKNKPCFCMTIRNLMMTLEEGLIITCLFPLFSALYMLFRASFRTLILTILQTANQREREKKSSLTTNLCK